MATIAVAPVVLKDVTFTVGTDSYESNVSGVKFTPAVSAVTWKGLTPTAVFSDAGSPVWTCTVSYAQDWVTANSLSQYLLANAGTSKVVVFKPQGSAVGKPVFTATLIMVPGDIGGDIDAVMVGSVTMGVVGVPVKTVG